MRFRLGVDIGGTFTDFLLTDNLGNKCIYKALTTPRNPSEGLFNGIQKIAEDNQLTIKEFLKSVDAIIHGTTITTNAVLTGNGAKTGFVTTKGFRDILNMRRGLKERQYDFKYSPPPPLVPRYLNKVVEERIDCEGQVLKELVEKDVQDAIDFFKQEKVSAIAVSLLFSFINPQHEMRVGEIIRTALPDAYVSLSCEVLPQIRAYERHSTTTLNAYVGPILSGYLEALDEKLRAHKYDGVLLIMQSNGGVMSPEVAERFAANTLLSGPAGGPTAGLFYAGIHRIENFITVDMGGTSFDACLVNNNKPALTTEGDVGGHHIAFPMISIHTIGAGGGSIAWINEGGVLQVGPKSAGADPGPVCYGKGGAEPAVTDADLVLGYLDPNFFAGGEIHLDKDSAFKAIEDKVAKPLKMDTIQAANGIYNIINAKMADALRVVSVEKGFDPREFALIVAGGAGPIHAGMIAREMEIPLVIVPRESSVFCASGMLFSDLKHNFVRTYTMPFAKLDVEEVNHRYREMKDVARNTLLKEGMQPDKIHMEYTVDIHYVGQFNEVEVPVVFDDELRLEGLGAVAEEFHRKHDRLYGYSLPGAPVELINLRAAAYGITEKPVLAKAARMTSKADVALKGSREAYFDDRFIRIPVYDGLKMGFGHNVKGPCIIEQPTTTIIVPKEYGLGCDEYNSYVMFHLQLADAEIKHKFGGDLL